MTTEIKVVATENISVPNNVINISYECCPLGQTLAGISWAASEAVPYESMLAVLQFVYSVVLEKMPMHTMWLLVSSSGWQPDTRIVRYKKLWGALSARGIVVPSHSKSQERTIEAEGKLKFFAVTPMSDALIESAAKILLEERSAYIVVVPELMEVSNFLQMGWEGDLCKDLTLVEHLSKNEGGIFKKLGEFDDNERGLIAVGKLDFVKQLYRTPA